MAEPIAEPLAACLAVPLLRRALRRPPRGRALVVVEVPGNPPEPEVPRSRTQAGPLGPRTPSGLRPLYRVRNCISERPDTPSQTPCCDPFSTLQGSTLVKINTF